MSNNLENANYKLAPEQFPRLNKHFYSLYPEDYFITKLYEICYRLADTPSYASQLSKKEFSIGRLTTKTEFNEEDFELLKQYARIDLVELYTHCLETFLRLFIAISKNSGCDWIELSNLNTNKFKKAIDKIAKNEFSFLNPSLSDSMIIQNTLLGIDYPVEEISEEVINNWRNWIVFAANQLKNNDRYNAFKHGMTLHSYYTGFSITNPDTGETLKKEGDAIEYLMKRSKDSRRVWAKRTDFINCDEFLTQIYVFGSFIKNMILLGKIKHLEEDDALKDRWIPNEKMTLEMLFSKPSETLQDVFNGLSSAEETLLYYK